MKAMDKLQTQAPPAKTTPQVEVQASPVRCPYCHTDCQPEDEAAIVCQRCLSRHHGGCWREGNNACSSCGSTKALKSAAPEITIAPAELKLVQEGLSREAVERVQRRLGVSEAAATTALLEAASHKLRTDQTRMPPGAIVALVAVVMAFLIPILAIILES